MDVAITVNGSRIEATVEPNLLLATWLREHLGLTGTHIGCDTSQWRACTVHLDGRSVKSCTMLAAEADGAAVLDDRGPGGGRTGCIRCSRPFTTIMVCNAAFVRPAW